jgi:hypothetical protein
VHFISLSGSVVMAAISNAPTAKIETLSCAFASALNAKNLIHEYGWLNRGQTSLNFVSSSETMGTNRDYYFAYPVNP